MRMLIDWMRATSAAKWAGSALIAWAGLAYVILPPVSIIGVDSVNRGDL